MKIEFFCDEVSARKWSVVEMSAEPVPGTKDPAHMSLLAQLPNISTEISMFLIKRLEGWKSLVTFLVSETDVVKSSEKHCVSILKKSSKNTAQAGAHLRTLFPEASAFPDLGSKVMEHMERTISMKEVYIALLKTQIIPNLKAIKGEISERISNLTAMCKESTKDLQKEVKRASDLTEKLNSLLAQPVMDGQDPSKDPWLVSLILAKSLKRARNKYNAGVEKVNSVKDNLMIWEREVSNRVVSNLSLLLGHQSAEEEAPTCEPIMNIDLKREWDLFTECSLSKCSAVTDIVDDILSIPREGANLPLIEGELRYISSVLKKWKGCYLVITPSGWLHQFPEKPEEEIPEVEMPKRSIWLRNSTLSPLHIPGQHHQELSILRAEKSITNVTSPSHIRYTSVNHEPLQPWWDVISTLTKVNLRAEEGASPECSRFETPKTPKTPTSAKSPTPSSSKPEEDAPEKKDIDDKLHEIPEMPQTNVSSTAFIASNNTDGENKEKHNSKGSYKGSASSVINNEKDVNDLDLGSKADPMSQMKGII